MLCLCIHFCNLSLFRKLACLWTHLPQLCNKRGIIHPSVDSSPLLYLRTPLIKPSESQNNSMHQGKWRLDGENRWSVNVECWKERMRTGEWPEYVRSVQEIAEEDFNYFFPFSTVTISPYISWQFYWQPIFYLPSIPRAGPFTQLPLPLKSHGLLLGLSQDRPWSKATPFTYNLLIKIVLLTCKLDGIIC